MKHRPYFGPANRNVPSRRWHFSFPVKISAPHLCDTLFCFYARVDFIEPRFAPVESSVGAHCFRLYFAKIGYREVGTKCDPLQVPWGSGLGTKCRAIRAIDLHLLRTTSRSQVSQHVLFLIGQCWRYSQLRGRCQKNPSEDLGSRLRQTFEVGTVEQIGRAHV